ncbi:MAG: diguanylate cyclase, partial [Gemmatimonadota bacterium]|nr:diguanylate cyclase [Gemmatimonadota bacterium]
MTDLLTGSVFFLLAGLGVLAAGVYVLARGHSTRRRLSFIQLGLASGLWLVVFGTLVAEGRSPAALRASADLFLFLGLLTATTAYQFVTYGLDFGAEQPGVGERRRGVVAMWGIAAGVAVFLASGAIRMVDAVELAGGVPVFDLHWQASPALLAIVAGLVGALTAAGRTWRLSPVVRRSRQAGLTAAGLLGLLLAPFAFLVPVLGPWSSGLGGLAALAGAGVLAVVASRESARRHEIAPIVRAAMETLRSPAVAVGREGTVQDANDAFLEGFDYERRRLLGRELGEIVRERDGSEIPLAELGIEARKGSRDVRVRGAEDRQVKADAHAVQTGHLDGEALPTIFLFDAPSLPVAAGGGRGPLDRWLAEVFRPEVPAIALYDLESGSFAGGNDQLLQLIGHTRQEAIGHSASDLGLPADGYRWSAFLERVRDEKRAELTEIDITRGDGDRRHVESCGVLLTTDGDRRGLLLFRDVTAIKQAEKKLRGQALYDPLTGLPMPALFEEQLKHALDRAQRYRKRVAVLLVDLEDLKAIRNEYGDAAGEKVLNGVAWRLYECFRKMDTLCRRGDDQFMVMLEDLEDAKGAATAADRFRGFMEESFELDSGEAIRVRATVGIAVSVPGQTEADDLIEWADVAIFRAKRRGESPIRIYDPERDAGDMERLTRADRLRQAIDDGELALRYQPLIDLVDKRIIGAEALVRWPQESGEV